MSSPLSITLAGCAWILAFDTAASLAAQRYGFAYARLAIVSLLWYFVVGVLVGRLTDASTAALAGAAVGAVEATAGWAISWAIGPGRPPPESRRPAAVAFAAAMVIVSAAVLACIGGLLSRL